MRLNTQKSIKTANSVYERYGSWKAAREASIESGGKFVVPSKVTKHKEDSSLKASNDAQATKRG